MGKLDNYITGRGGLTDKYNKNTNRRNSKKDNNKGKPKLTSAQRSIRKIRNFVLKIVSPAAILWVASAMIPVDEIMLQDDVKNADTAKLVAGFNANSKQLSMKYPGKIAWILTQNGQHIDQGTTKYIPVKGAYHAGFTYLRCDAEDYITHYGDYFSSGGSAKLRFNCQLSEDPNSIPG